MASNVDNILAELNGNDTVSIYLPSLHKSVPFKPLTTGQQKRIINTAVDNPIFQTRFIVTTYTIISENSIESLDPAKLNMLDWISIILQYRVNMYGPTFDIIEDNSTYTVDINTVLDKINNQDGDDPSINKFVEDAKVRVKYNFPSLLNFYLIEKELRYKGLNDEKVVSSNNDMSGLIGDAFISEVVKYITDVEINKDGEFIPTGYATLNFKDRVQVVEALNSDLIKKIVPYITKCTDIVNSLLKVSSTDSKITKVLDLSVDAALFPVE